MGNTCFGTYTGEKACRRSCALSIRCIAETNRATKQVIDRLSYREMWNDIKNFESFDVSGLYSDSDSDE